MPDNFFKLCHLNQIPDGTARGFDPLKQGRDTLFIVRQGHLLRAYLNDCPHWPGSPMAWKKNEYLTTDGSHIICYGHRALFDIQTGFCLSGPCAGQSLLAIQLCIDEENVVHICLENLK